jgi:hypothetical protein
MAPTPFWVPEVAPNAPFQFPVEVLADAVQLVAFTVVHVTETLEPEVTVTGPLSPLTKRSTVGATGPAVRLTCTLSVVEPPGPVQVILNDLEEVIAPTLFWVPEVALAPFQFPVRLLANAVQDVALEEVQTVVTFDPEATLTGPLLPLTVSVTVGGETAVIFNWTVSLEEPPGPVQVSVTV